MAFSQQQTYYTSDDSGLRTWWHGTGQINTSGRVDNDAVRQSRKYHVQVSKAKTPTSFHDSFVYETIPRNGNGKIYSPWDDPKEVTFKDDDGISIELEQGINMAWTQFEYGEDVKIKISLNNGSKLGPPADVIIRPTSTFYDITSSPDGGLEILVPMDSNGRRFSVEFKDDLYTYRSDGGKYVKKGGSIVGIEPTNALLIFASPFLPENMVPQGTVDDVKEMTPGPINQNDWGSSAVLYFPPGVYWMNSNPQDIRPKYGENHIKLDPKTKWVYLAPGAYVKGAIEYTTKENFCASGHGVLSGEHYVYQANPFTYYQGKKCDKHSLRMWSHYGLDNQNNQTWSCIGPTINSPPFNTMDFYNDPERADPSVSVQISDYKQVGAFFMQTDGPQVYPNSNVHDVFYHANDDAIKTYYSNVSISRLIVWKVFNDPVIQMGWTSREVKNVSIDKLDIIHTRYRKSETEVPSAIIGASPFYSSAMKNPDPSKSISMSVSNVTCEGPGPALLRISPLQNYDNFRISNVSFPDGLQTNSIGIGQSLIPAKKINSFGKLRMDLRISNWTIKGTKVTMDNFQANQLGQFDIDAAYWTQWKIE